LKVGVVWLAAGNELLEQAKTKGALKEVEYEDDNQ
jgi:hypothetical protein